MKQVNGEPVRRPSDGWTDTTHEDQFMGNRPVWVEGRKQRVGFTIRLWVCAAKLCVRFFSLGRCWPRAPGENKKHPVVEW